MKSSLQSKSNASAPGVLTREEIFQQSLLWPTTLERVQAIGLSFLTRKRPVIVTGAGTSAYAGAAIAGSWPGGLAIPTTDLLLYSKDELRTAAPNFADDGLLISLARSGDSPESLAVVSKFQHLYPQVEHLVITCNANGRLARMAGVEPVILDPRTNDRSLAMTSSFTNLTLAGLALQHAAELTKSLPAICGRVQQALPVLDTTARDLANSAVDRIAILASTTLHSLAMEASLKILEMSAGKIVAMPESFLGLRHGPMSFLRADSVVLCFLSSNPNRRRYEEDLIRELRDKSLGRIVAIGGDSGGANDLADIRVPAHAPDLPDYLRVPFEIPFAQLLAYRLSLAKGLNPDSPSPEGVITRVVQEFRIHEEPAGV
jgi:tagatose-6-phosphate ketose/aldose isomerase